MPERRIAVAFSGGHDSTALLHATITEAVQYGGIEVLALHVHHGLSPSADAWLAHCALQCDRFCKTLGPVSFVSSRLSGKPARGESTEAWARQARYEALREMALTRGASVVLLAHHRRDQAETWLLQALRGAGAAGLSAMPRSAQRDGITWKRPWLQRPHAEIAAYVQHHRLAHIQDESNADPRFARNRLRLQVWPALTEAFDQAEATLATAADWAQQASAALGELAAIDLAEVADGQQLHVGRWCGLSLARRSNALRAWLRVVQGDAAPATLITRLLDELSECDAARWPIAGGALRLHRDVLRFVARIPPSAAVKASTRPPETQLKVRRAGTYRLPGWSGALQVERVREGGVPLAWLAHCELRPRAGAERFQAGIGRPPRNLKRQYQSAAVPSCERGGPLVYSGGRLVFVPGLGLDARVIGLPGQPLVTLRWNPLPA